MRRFPAVLSLSLALLGAAAPALPAQGAGTWSLHAEFDLFLGLKAGVEYRVTDSLGLRASLGACVISPLQFTYTLVAVQHFFAPDDPFQLDAEVGLIQATCDFLEPLVDLDPSSANVFAYWVPGAAVVAGFCPAAGQRIALRAGCGAIFGFDLGAWQGPKVHPNLALEYQLRLGK